jgi:hypothetical protein
MTRPVTGEPTHIDGDGKERPGSHSLTDTITVSVMSDADAAWAENVKDSKVRNMYSAQNPHLTEPYSPLETLIGDAFERYGNMSIDTLDAAVKRIMLRYANRIVEDMRIHPYGTMPDLDYYIHLQDTRPIPDEIMISGLAFHYAKWQKSSSASTFFAEYSQAMNQILYQRKYGSGKLQMNTVDKDPREVK